MRFHKGAVTSLVDFGKSGGFRCKLGGQGSEVKVEYTSPFISANEGLFSPPKVGTEVIVCEFSTGDSRGVVDSTYYLVGCINKTPSDNLLLDTPENSDLVNNTSAKNGFSLTGPIRDEIYETKGLVPEMLTFMSHSGNSLLIRDKSRAESEVAKAIQDTGLELKSSLKKSVKLDDSPQIDSVIITNGSDTDKIIFCSEASTTNPERASKYASNELQMHTKGPLNLNTIESSLELNVCEKGKNIELENRAEGITKELSGAIVHTDSNWGGTFDLQDTGNEDFGCIRIHSYNRNIILVATGEDSVVRVEVPGENSKVIVKTAGTVNIKAEKKIKLDSSAEIEIVAPTVRVESNNTYINGEEGVWIN